jgi:hypothetical protein
VHHSTKLTTLNTHTSHSCIRKHLHLLFHSNPETITHFHKTSQRIFRLWQSEVNFSIMGQPVWHQDWLSHLSVTSQENVTVLEMHNLTWCICTGTLQFCSWLWHMGQEELSIYSCSMSILYCTLSAWLGSLPYKYNTLVNANFIQKTFYLNLKSHFLSLKHGTTFLSTNLLGQ